jgi:hypothetical protein
LDNPESISTPLLRDSGFVVFHSIRSQNYINGD